MSKTLLRLAFLLFALSFVGFAGLNGSAYPGRIQSAYAANVAISINAPSGQLSFTVGSLGCPSALVGGDSCTAVVTVRNEGDVFVVLSAPTVTDGGPLDTCTGDDPDAPGAGGDNLTTTLGALGYTPGITPIPPSGSRSFDLTVSLVLDIGNACQGKSGTITVDLSGTGRDREVDVDSPTPTPSPSPPTQSSEPPAPSQQVAGTQATATPVQQAPTPVATSTQTFTSEVLPVRLPVSGQGPSIEDQARSIAKMVFLGTGLLSLGLLLLALQLRERRERGSK